MNVLCNTKETRRIRAKVCAPLRGEVLEIGFGTGLNLPHLPPSVGRLLAVDPLQRGRDLAEERLAEVTWWSSSSVWTASPCNSTTIR